MSKKITKTVKGVLTEKDLQSCLNTKMTIAEICEKFDVKPGKVRSTFTKMMVAEKGIEDLFTVAKARTPTVQKNGKFTVNADFVNAMGWKPGVKLDIVTDTDKGQIVVGLTK